MKPFRYRFSKLLNPVIVNRSGTNIRVKESSNRKTILLNIPPGKVEYVEIPVLTENEISTPEEAGNAASVEMKTVKAYTFFCVAGTEFAEGGDGSESNPWESVNYALNQLQSIVDCFSQTCCCEYIQLRCSGVCNYEVHNIQKDGNGEWIFTSFYGENRFILSGLNVEIDFSYNQTFEDDTSIDPVQVEEEKNLVRGIQNTVFLNSKISVSASIEAFLNRERATIYGYSHVRGFYGCSGVFYLCEATVKSYCTTSGKSKTAGSLAAYARATSYGFIQCDGTFIQAKSKASASGKATDRTENDAKKTSEGSSFAASFYSCRGIFYSCEGQGIGISEGSSGRLIHYASSSQGVGFTYCNGNFYSCTGYGNASAKAANNIWSGNTSADAYGFSSCYGNFYRCTSESDASASGYECEVESFGFYSFSGNNNILISCSANAKSVASGQEYLYRACGFLNCKADFYDCSSSERICESNGTYETNCENFECDI